MAYICYLINPPNSPDLGSPDSTFLLHCPTPHCPGIKTKLVLLDLEPSLFLFVLSDHLFHCLFSNRPQASWKGPHPSVLVTAEPLAPSVRGDLEKHHKYLSMKKWPQEAVTCSRLRLAFQVPVFPTNTKLRAQGKAPPEHHHTIHWWVLPGGPQTLFSRRNISY